MNPTEVLNTGVKILDPFMNRNGFTFSLIESAKGSGGNYAFGHYSREDRVIELHYRYSLGKIKYSIGNRELNHDEYIKLLEVYGKNHYPSFSEDCFQAFYDLLFDLENFTGDFISGSGEQFAKLTDLFKENPNKFKGFKGLSVFSKK